MQTTSVVKQFLRAKLNEEQIRALRRWQAFRFRRVQGLLWRALFGRNLNMLATIYNTDKWNDHWYTQHYHKHFSELRTRRLNVLEIGIGGYDDPQMGGSSLKMWRTYFPNSMIHGVDIYDKSPHNESRIKTHQGSQADTEFLNALAAQIGRLDIIIDDGSHMNEHVLITFRHLFPKLAPGGIYVIEDTQTSYMEGYGGSSRNLDSKTTSIGFLKSLVDSVNASSLNTQRTRATEFDGQIAALHFYENIVFVEKARISSADR